MGSILMPTKPPPWGRKNHTNTKSEPKSNATTGSSSHKQDTRQLVTCEFQSSTSKPDKEVHFRYSRFNSESNHRHKIQQRYVAPCYSTPSRMPCWPWDKYCTHLLKPSIKLGAKLTGQQNIPRRRNAPPLHLTQILITLCRGGTRRCRLAKPTHTKSEPKSNATTGNSSDKQDTRQLVTCEFQGSTSKPDKEVH